MRHSLLTPVAIACLMATSACAPEPPTTTVSTIGPAASAGASQAALSTENCRDYKAPVEIDGSTIEVSGTVCQQPDGAWRVATPPPQQGAPPQSVTAQPYPYPAYYYPYPYPYGYPFFPWGFADFGFGFGFHNHRHRW